MMDDIFAHELARAQHAERLRQGERARRAAAASTAAAPAHLRLRHALGAILIRLGERVQPEAGSARTLATPE